MTCSTERNTPGRTQGKDLASPLTLNTAVKPEDEESSTQFQRTAYSGSPSLFVHPSGRTISVTQQSCGGRASSEQLRQRPLYSKRDKVTRPGGDQPSRHTQPRVRRWLRLGGRETYRLIGPSSGQSGRRTRF